MLLHAVRNAAMLRCFQKSHWEIQKEEEEEEEEEEQKKKKERKTHLQRLSSGLLDGRQPLGTPPLPHTAHLLTPLSPQPVEGLDQVMALLIPATKHTSAAACRAALNQEHGL